MKVIPVIALATLILLVISCADTANINYRTEPSDPDIIDKNLWEGIPAGLNGGFGTVDIAYKKSAPPLGNISEELSLWGWIGEKVNGQFLLWSKQEVSNISVKASDLRGESGIIEKYNIGIRLVRYVLSDEFLNGCGRRLKDTIPVHISPDMLDLFNLFGLNAMETRPIWVTVLIPENTAQGYYSGELTVTSDTDTMVFSIGMEVTGQTLPHPADWKFHLDLWQNPYAVARYHGVQLWSEEHWDLLKPLYRMLAESGQKCITTTLNDMPWGGQTYDPFGSMIGWLKNTDGSWEYDYSLFDQYVNFQMDCGITAQINCYSMVPWNNRFRYYDQDSARFVETQVLPGSKEYEALWEPFLYQFREHLREIGWLNITTIAMDERKREEMIWIIDLIKRTVPEIKVSLAGEIQEGVDDYVYDLSIAIGNDPSREEIEARVQKGKPTTFYTCCSRPEHPNNFTFSPPADNAIIGWYTAARGYSGFLRWAYNSWVEDPVHDSRFRTWPSGDTYLVYPGARSSIRFERITEGIQDYEKLRIVREKLAYNPSVNAAAFEDEIEEFLSTISLSALDVTPSADYVNRGKELLYRISKYLTYNQ
ncbi:MAG TPA: glycoside hydrolase domain-containing protein [Bacteroidales bacterium]|nr:glycoside hydrolase domain-containing protein [Bacteroidales bacterium]